MLLKKLQSLVIFVVKGAICHFSTLVIENHFSLSLAVEAVITLDVILF